MLRLALSEISTWPATFDEDVEAYAAAGFDAIGIWELKLPPDDEGSRRILNRSRLHVANCVPAVPSVLPLEVPGMEGPADPAERVAALCASMARLAAFRPESVLVLTGPLGDRPPAEARAIVTEGLREVAAAARRAGVRLGLEPTHASESAATSFLSSIGEAAALLDEAGLEDVGIMVAAHQVWDTPSLADDIARHGSRITGLHVADRAAPHNGDRLPPGEGVTRPERVVRLLREQGFDGSLDVAIFSTFGGFWGLPLDAAARRAYAAARRTRELSAV
jgi:sugar phosphate isomerase/epimerase